MKTTQNSVPLWMVLALATSYTFSKMPIDPEMTSFLNGIGIGSAVGFGLKYLFSR